MADEADIPAPGQEELVAAILAGASAKAGIGPKRLVRRYFRVLEALRNPEPDDSEPESE